MSGRVINGREPRLWTLSFIFLGSWFSVLGPLSAQGAERIVSLNACTDELLLQLAEPNQISGVTRFDLRPIVKRR